MAQQTTLDALAAQVTATVGVMQSATTLIGGIAQRQQDAITKAIANGATAEQLAPVQAEVDSLKAQTAALSSAVAANSPTPPAP